jgi:hypothetical protein
MTGHKKWKDIRRKFGLKGEDRVRRLKEEMLRMPETLTKDELIAFRVDRDHQRNAESVHGAVLQDLTRTLDLGLGEACILVRSTRSKVGRIIERAYAEADANKRDVSDLSPSDQKLLR